MYIRGLFCPHVFGVRLVLLSCVFFRRLILRSIRTGSSSSPPADKDAYLKIRMYTQILARTPRPIFASPGSTQIRQEYIHVPAETYCQKRAEVLRDFLAKGSIFSTEEYRRTLEASARANVEAEVDMLDEGAIPVQTEQIV